MKILFSFRFICLIHLVMFMLLFCVDDSKADEQCSGEVCFSWAFGAIVRPDDSARFVKISRDTALKSGDQIKMLIKLEKKCFVYVFYYSSQGQLDRLFPYSLSQFSTDYETSKTYYIPQGNFVLELDDNVGQEKFYLIASAQRLQELENLFGSYESAEDSKKPESVKNIIHEIRHLRKRHKKFTAAAERPVTSTGSIRAHITIEETEFPDLDKIAIKVNAKDFFAKTFTIDHK